MVKASKFKTATYLNAKDSTEYNNNSFIIDSVFSAQIGSGDNIQEKLCIRLSGIDKPIALNQTNLSILIDRYGDNTDEWINHKVILHIVKVNFSGSLVDGLQVEPT
jgi:hypothetical protein